MRPEMREKGFCVGANEACGQHDRLCIYPLCTIEISVLNALHDAPTRASSFVRDTSLDPQKINCIIYLVLAYDGLKDNDSIVAFNGCVQ